MPYRFGGSLGVPFEEDNESLPSGCFFRYPSYHFNANPRGGGRAGVSPCCRRCDPVGGNAASHEDDLGDWTGWCDSADGDDVSPRYCKVPVGSCEDIGWHPVHDRGECRRAAGELRLEDTGDPVSTMLAERPAGCYYLQNYQDGTGTLWLNENPYSDGNGAETSEPELGKLRQPICSTEKRSAPAGDPFRGDPPRFRKISNGTCADAGARPVTSRTVCEAAARSLGMPDTRAKTIDSGDGSNETKPEGCYYFRNFEDLTATLWLNTAEAARGQGAETSDRDRGLLRQPICDFGADGGADA
mmetsp:Transcript_60704/g.163626  ORF Transcript_60704/g.163626 Transcript_60704/m.163626 type:complete len:300 (-) Transcript_60704:548-1447(-)